MAFDAGTVKGTLDLNIRRFKSAVQIAARRFGLLKRAAAATRPAVRDVGNIFRSTAFKLVAGVASVYALKKAFDLLKNTMTGASRVQRDYEQSVQNLRSSLALAGSRDVTGATAAMESFATSIQRSSGTADTAVLQVAALLRTIGVSEEKLKTSTKAVLDYAAAFNRDAVESAKQFGRTLSGLTGELGEAFPAVRALSAEALKSGEAFDVAATVMGGYAKMASQTTAGALTKLGNTLNDLRKRLGAAINEFLGPLAEKLDLTFQSWVDNLQEGSGGFQKLVDTMKPAFEAVLGGVRLLIDGFFMVGVAIKGVQVLGAIWQQAWITYSSTFIEVWSKVIGVIAKVFAGIAEFIASIPGLSEGVKQSVQGVADFFTKVQEGAQKTDDYMDVLQRSVAEVADERKKELTFLKAQAEAVKHNVQTENGLLNFVTKVYNLKAKESEFEKRIREEKEQQIANEQRIARAAAEREEYLKKRLKHLHEATGLGRESWKTAQDLADETREAATAAGDLADETREVATAAGAAVSGAGQMANEFDRAATSATNAANAVASAASAAASNAGTRAGESRRAGSSTSLDFSDPFRAVALAQQAQEQLRATHPNVWAGRSQINAAAAYARGVGAAAEAAVNRALSDFTSSIISELNSAGVMDPTDRSRIIRERIAEAQRLGVLPSTSSLSTASIGLV